MFSSKKVVYKDRDGQNSYRNKGVTRWAFATLLRSQVHREYTREATKKKKNVNFFNTFKHDLKNNTSLGQQYPIFQT
jgi:hypothetical protein